VTAPHGRLGPFVAVGAAGFAVQLALLHVLVAYAGVHYLVATALAVEAAILLNFACHSQWTWRDRQPRPPEDKRAARLRQLARFNSLSALSSLTGNVVLTALLVRTLGVPVVVANVFAVVLVSAINFAGLDRWVFAATSAPGRPSARVSMAAVLAVLSLSLPPDASAAELTAATRRAWQRYVAVTEARIEGELHTPGRFLSLDFDTAADRQRARAALRDGAVIVTNLQAERGAGVEVPGGTIHHWRGAVFVPHATVDDVLHAVSDPTGTRAHRQEDVLEARVLSRSPNALRLFLKLQRQAIVSVAYNTEHQVVYRVHGSGRASSRSVATRIAEIVNLGEPDEHERQPGMDRGFLWGLNAYWRYEAMSGGVVVELESLTLSRDVPWGVGAVASPVVDRVARESLARTLDALRARFGARAVS
jgi:putative flippase GtrA